MNKIYKNVWNHVTRTFTAVSEIKAKKGKVGKSVLATTVASSFLAVDLRQFALMIMNRIGIQTTP